MRMLSVLSKEYKHDECSKACLEGTDRQHFCSCVICMTAYILSSVQHSEVLDIC